MFAYEQEFLKCHGEFEQLVELVRQASVQGRRMDEVQRERFAGLLRRGSTM